MSRGGRRRRRRQRPGGNANEEPRLVDDPFPSLFAEWGGELWFVIDYTEGGAPIGLRASEIDDASSTTATATDLTSRGSRVR